MPGAQPRRPFETRMASTARRGALVPNGVPGVYRVPRRGKGGIVPNDPGSATAVVEWVQPDDVELEYGMSLSRRRSRGTDMMVSPPDMQGTWEASIVEACIGTEISAVDGLIPSTDAFLGQEYEDDYDAQAQQTRYSAIFDFAPVSPSPPPGMSVEYENPAGVSVSDISVYGTYTCGTNNPLGEFDNTGIGLYLAPDDEPWYSPSDVGALTELGIHTGGVYNEAHVIVRDVGPFSAPGGEEVHVLVQAEAVQNMILSTQGVGDAGYRVTLLCSQTYRPPRYRFV